MENVMSKLLQEMPPMLTIYISQYFLTKQQMHPFNTQQSKNSGKKCNGHQ